MSKPLQGVRVVDMSHVIAGPFASLLLRQLGAEVIKVESPLGGDVWRAGKRMPGETGSTASFVAMNAGKKSLAVDIRTQEGAQIVRDLAGDADVFIENFRPGTVHRYGLDFESVRSVNPSIIYCSISGYGQTGEFAARGAYDNVIQALSGMMMMAGESQDAPPIKVGFPVVDVGAGILGALAIVSELARQGTRVGKFIDVSMLHASLMLMYPQASHCLTFGTDIPRSGNRGFSGSPGSDTFRCSDGWISTAANTPAQFRKLAATLGVPEVCEDPALLDLEAFNAVGGGFVVPRDMDTLTTRIAAAISLRSAFELEASFNALGIPAARVRRLGEFVQESGEFAMSQAFASHPRGDGYVRTPGPGFVISDEDERPPDRAPELGEHNEEVLRSSHLSADRLEALKRAGVLL